VYWLLQGGSGEEGAPAPMDAMSVLHEARALLSGGGGGPRGPDEFSSHTAMGSIYPSQDQLVRCAPTCCRRVSRDPPQQGMRRMQPVMWGVPDAGAAGGRLV
jgi:hypothetical protein